MHAATKIARERGNRYLISPEAGDLEVAAFSRGSFGIHFESKERPNLFGASKVGLATTRIDELMATLEMTPEKALSVSAANRGHLVSVFRELLQFVAEQGTPIRYRWAEPAMAAARGHRMSPIASRALCAVLDQVEELSQDAVEIHGHYVKVDTLKRSWGIRAALGKTYSGTLHPGASPEILDGLVIGTRAYRLDCVERREVEVASGKPRHRLYLLSTTPD